MIQIYTGNGKGKTTAALGLALRASGAGHTIFIAQFVKGKPYSEHKALQNLKKITIQQFGRKCFIKSNPTPVDYKLAEEGMKTVEKIILSKKYKIIILDEINVALYLKLLSIARVVKLLKSAPRNIEFILTGRYAPKQLIKIADLVTVMNEKKHYYSSGYPARKGIEY